ncbi:hypothetical protein ABFW00_10730 [Mycobacteroides abscessus]|uniref:hypothetical protein n=1 Tax=Mycobacteroides abscessus TaxID=36809 RepID=UPI0034CE9FCA
MGNAWAELDIPEAWESSVMLRNMVADHLTPDESVEGALDDATRERMVGLALMGHVELASKTAGLIKQFSTLVTDYGELVDRVNQQREALLKAAEMIDGLETRIAALETG